MKNQNTTRTSLRKLHNANQFVRGGGQAIVLAFLLIATATKAQPFVNPGDEFLILCEHASTTIQLINTDPGMNVDLLSTSGVTSPGYSYDPGTGELTITGLGITGPKSYGQYNFEMQPSNDRFTIYIIQCCQEIDFDYIVVNDATSNVGSYFSGNRILILDELIADVIPTEFYSSEIYFGADAKITIADDVEFFSDGSIFQNYCDYRWDGIFASDEQNVVEFIESELVFSARGIYASNNAKVKAQYSTFSQNLIGVGVLFNTATGSYYGSSNLYVSDNLFNTTLSYSGPSAIMGFATGSPIPDELFDLYDHYGYTGFSTTNFAHVLLVESDYIQVGKPSTTANNFSGFDGVGVFAIQSQAKIQNNVFDTISIGILADEAELIVGGSSTSERNWFYTSAFSATASKCYAQNNYHINSSIGISEPEKFFAGTNPGTEFLDNIFWDSNFSIYQTNSSVKKVAVTTNDFNNSQLVVTKVNSASINEALIISDNEFATNQENDTINDQTSSGYYQLVLNNCYKARVGANTFNLLTTGSPPPDYYFNGIYINGSTNSQIKDNYFYNRLVSIYGTGYLTDSTVVSCKTFDDHVIGMYFKDATLNDQGNSSEGVDNIWIDQTLSIARIKVDNSPFTYYHMNNASKDPQSGIGVDIVTGSFVTSSSPTSSLSNCNILNKASIAHNEISFFPNPTSGNISISLPSNEFGFVEIFTLQGKLVAKDFLTTITELNLNLPNGTYLIRISSSGKFSSELLIIQK